MKTVTIKTAYSYSRKFKSYHARAYVLESGFPGLPAGHTSRHSLTSGIGDTAAEATEDAIRYCLELMSRDRGMGREPVERMGRVSAAILDALAF